MTAAQLKLSRLHLEARSATLAKQLAVLTGLPVGFVVPDHASIPEIPAVRADEAPAPIDAVGAARSQALAKQFAAKADKERLWVLPEIGFGAQYNRNTTLLNSINDYYRQNLPANNFSSGFSIRVHLFDLGLHAKERESAAEALRAKVEAEDAQNQSDVQVTELTASIRELDAEAEVASLKQQIAEQQLESVTAELQVGNGNTGTPGAPPQALTHCRAAGAD